MNLDRLPRVSLARLPTPLDDAPRLASAVGVARVLVKRDDLTDLALGGNKVRKLEFLLGDALAQNADTIVTTAGAQSNFLRLTSAAARRVGMKPVLVVRGRPDEVPQGNLLLMRIFDAEIHFVDTEDPYADSTIELMHEIAGRVGQRGGRPYVIHVATFSSGLASVGYVPAAFELAQQLGAYQTRADHVVLAVGSGTTQAGLLLGLKLAGIETHVLGASVNTPAHTLQGLVAAQVRDAAGILGVSADVVDARSIDITDAYVGPGYGIPTADSTAAVRLAARAEGLLFDPIYTGKAWAALDHGVRSGAIRREAIVVFMHTGGAPNVFLHADAVAGDGVAGVTVPGRWSDRHGGVSVRVPSESHELLRDAVRTLCRRFPDAYWRGLDRTRAYPDEFVQALTAHGYLAALIPEAYGGAGLTITDASIILEEIHRSGGNAAACHAQMYTMGALLRHGSAAQKARYLPKIATGELRLQAFAVTEPDAGSDTTSIRTTAVRRGAHYVVNGQKIFTSRVRQSDLMMLLARTTPIEALSDKTEGLSLFLVDLRDAGDRLRVEPIETMLNHHTNQIFFDALEVSVENLIGEENRGFRYIIDGWNAERILLAAEAIGDGRWFIDRASRYARERVVFGRPIGANQGVQFPIAQAYAHVEAADLVHFDAARRFDAGEPCGAQANMAKYLAAEAAWEAANVCLSTHGGYGFAVEFDVERKFRETRLFKEAPISNNLVLAYLGHRVLGLPRSY